MDPIAAQNVDLVKAIQALLVNQGTPTESSLLAAILGQEVEVLFQAMTPQGVKLQLPSGQTITAQGDLPYPEGTQLQVRVLPPAAGDTTIRMQLLEARPPAPPTLLAPLVQSEAQTLAVRLTQASLPPELEPLMQLLTVLADTPITTQPLPLPATATLQAAIKELPEPVATNLGRMLGLGNLASTQEIATSLQSVFQETQQVTPDASAKLLSILLGSSPPELPTNLPAVAPTGSAEPKALSSLIQQVIEKIQVLIAQHPEIPEEHKDTIVAWIRNQLQKAATSSETTALPAAKSAAAASKSETMPRPTTTATTTASTKPAVVSTAVTPKLAAALEAHAGPKAELPESWESWIHKTITVLADPAASPQEAPFHAIQAKEGTAFFEIPLPWAQTSPLQIWVESDAPDEQRSARDMTKRVLLGLRFSQLGETRLGMAQSPGSLQIRIWTEHPEALETEKTRMEDELKDLGKPVDLRIYALTYGPDGTIPTIRSLVAGPSLRALG
jgi:hypothetical protein